jgi:hypothetical protein
MVIVTFLACLFNFIRKQKYGILIIMLVGIFIIPIPRYLKFDVILKMYFI